METLFAPGSRFKLKSAVAGKGYPRARMLRAARDTSSTFRWSPLARSQAFAPSSCQNPFFQVASDPGLHRRKRSTVQVEMRTGKRAFPVGLWVSSRAPVLISEPFGVTYRSVTRGLVESIHRIDPQRKRLFFPKHRHPIYRCVIASGRTPYLSTMYSMHYLPSDQVSPQTTQSPP